MLWTTIAVLLILWLLGFSFKVGGNLVHTLLVVALVVVIVRLIKG
ncbi:MAG: lmo0937 family membrane protein [bacterium]|nr:lmo0937 family membrane protein [bacterium]